ncbi:LOB domain-containing protein 36-like [Macadamia integrifolia]|uniref:LOB domain-containing protein 36-like n=1 Tax=Macadamia integrifolia TaxID=60698 RepID=UPI001C4FA2CC|nr:LOB domain-containing protein 36-like [Macadamia integrifolia]XP_042493439.1 LOB domain-containing protein 36-like [Macadamia integrifolia]XP_042493440.1 LOB domain-containing protein 36-like [Macadamia integrifolia]
MASSSNSPCAACKFLRRKCTQECVFAPYFPPDQPTKFANVHKVFGASNVAKLLNELNPSQREDAVNSLAYEAEARLRDPVYGCVGLISILQHRLKQVQHDLTNAKKELANYIGPAAMLPLSHQHPHHQLLHPHHNPSSNTGPYGMSPVGLGMPAAQAQAQAQLLMREQQQQQQHHQQMLEAQHLAAVVAAREQQEMMRSYAQQQQQEELVRFNGGYDGTAAGGGGGFNQMSTALPSSLALAPFDNPFQIPQPQQEHQHQHHQHQRAGSDEIKNVDPSS